MLGINQKNAIGISGTEEEFEQYFFTKLWEKAAKLPYHNDAIIYTLMEYGVEEARKNGLLDNLHTAPKMPVQKQSSFASAHPEKKITVNKNSSEAVAIMEEQRSLKIPAHCRDIFEGLLIISVHTAEKCDFEFFHSKVADFLYNVKKYRVN